MLDWQVMDDQTSPPPSSVAPTAAPAAKPKKKRRKKMSAADKERAELLQIYGRLQESWTKTRRDVIKIMTR